MHMKKFPKHITVLHEEDDGDGYLVASRDINETALAIGDRRTVAVYKLVEARRIKVVAKVRK